MLSIGLRFGQGFDRMNTLKVVQGIPVGFDYDLVVVGSSPGGIALAREAAAAGKKVIIIRTRKFTPAEEYGFDEDLNEMSRVLELSKSSFSSQESILRPIASQITYKSVNRNKSAVKSNTKKLQSSKSLNRVNFKKLRKVRPSRLDLNNEMYRRGKECLKMMQNLALLGDLVEKASKGGWRIQPTTLNSSVNWHKMTEDVMDYVMEKNYNLLNELASEGVKIIDGNAKFIDRNTLTLYTPTEETNITSDIICIAPTGLYEFPNDVDGSDEYGISIDDFPRLYKPPGKTLIVGGTPEALECAGILTCCRFIVTVVSRRELLEDYDREITEMIVKNLKKRKVNFLMNSVLKSIGRSKNNKIIASFSPLNSSQEGPSTKKESKVVFLRTEEFDTVLFATKRKVDLKYLGLNSIKVEMNEESGKIKTNSLDATTISNIYALGDAAYGIPSDYEVHEVSGKLLGKRLFGNEDQKMDYSFYPSAIYTPLEYAFVGISEDLALSRLDDVRPWIQADPVITCHQMTFNFNPTGEVIPILQTLPTFGIDCVEVYHGFFESMDIVVSPIKDKCFAKVIVFKTTDLVIGMHILGPRSAEVIQGFAAAIKNNLTMKTLKTIVGVPGTNAKEFLKLKEIRSYETLLSSMTSMFGVSIK